jgi:transposase
MSSAPRCPSFWNGEPRLTAFEETCGDVWTCERVARVIRREFGVSYHPAHVSRLLKALRQSLQKPQRRANQRDEEAIERWKEERWPSLKKGRKRKAGP